MDEQISSANREKAQTETTMVNMSYSKMRDLFRSVEDTMKGHVTGQIVFTPDSFSKLFSEESRTYIVSSDNKAFQANMSGYSIFASCKDGTDNGIRLEAYMAAEKGGKEGWKVERCYMSQAELNRAQAMTQDVSREEQR